MKTPGQIAYEADVATWPFYSCGGPRKTWAQLGDVERWSWERSPTPRRQSAATPSPVSE